LPTHTGKGTLAKLFGNEVQVDRVKEFTSKSLFSGKMALFNFWLELKDLINLLIPLDQNYSEIVAKLDNKLSS